jgi:hypothetical protein
MGIAIKCKEANKDNKKEKPHRDRHKEIST